MNQTVTWLYVPGDRPERFAKAVASNPSVVILDLEDAVSPAHKETARHHVADFLTRPLDPGAPRVHVRINHPDSPWGLEDVKALAGSPGLEALRVPKVESTATLDRLIALQGPDPSPLYALIESARGLQAMEAIAHHRAIAGIALGEQDLAAELSITHPDAFDQIRLQAVLAAAAAGIPPVPMSVYPHIHDLAGLTTDCAHGRALGMFGRSAIHPRQLPVIAEAFQPSAEEIDWARSVDLAAQDCDVTGIGAVALPDGQFIDAPIITKARRILHLAGTAPVSQNRTC